MLSIVILPQMGNLKTKEQNELLQICEAPSPHRRGYVVRVHAQWYETHPELNSMALQNLQHQVAQLSSSQEHQ